MVIFRNVLSGFIILFLVTRIGIAQHVNFGLFAGEGITMVKGSVDVINFNLERQWIITGAPQVSVPLQHEGAAVIAITAQRDLDITITIDAPQMLELDANNQIPFTLRFAYSNVGAADEATAKSQAVEVPAGFVAATFPVLRRVSGPPGPPPTPPHSGFTAPRGTAFLFIYGTLGNINLPTNIRSGLYSATINIYANYAN